MKIGWILSSNKNAAGSRIHGWNMHEELLKKGIDSNIIYSSAKYNETPKIFDMELEKITKSKYNIIVFVGFKSDSNIIKLIKTFQNNFIKVVYIKTDEIPHDIVKLSDATIMVTDFAKEEFPDNLKSKIHVVFDGYEHDGSVIKKPSKDNNIKLVFLSNNVYDKFPQIDKLPDNTKLVIIGPPKERVERFTPGKKIFTDTPYGYEYKIWNMDTIEEDVLDCDVAVIPYPDKHLRSDYINRKSSNRLVLFMSYGIPVIASPVAEYKRLIQNGKNGFIANSREDWQKYILMLRDNPLLRVEIGSNGRKSVLRKYSKKSQSDKYLEIFQGLIKTNS